MPIPEQLLEFPSSLADDYPKAVEAMYEACQAGAAKHTGADKLFGGLTTDIEQYPLQHADCQVVPTDYTPIDKVVEVGDFLSPGIVGGLRPFARDNAEVIGNIHDTLLAGYNVVLAVPTHSQVHDIALPEAQIAYGLWHNHKVDEPDQRFQIFAKSLAWYDFLGIPIPETARGLANTLFSLPHSKSGDSFDNSLQGEFNRRMLQQLGSRLELGGQLLTLATGGATNYRQHFGKKVIAECQAAIHPGTARLMTAENTLTLPIACYIDPQHHITTQLGELTDVKTEDDCLDLAIWGADQYSAMSGIHTFQARTRDQAERFAGEKARDLLQAARERKFVRWLLRSEEIEAPNELTDLPE